MTHEGVRKATKKAVHLAKESGAVISFDPNLRPPAVEVPGRGEGTGRLGLFSV